MSRYLKIRQTITTTLSVLCFMLLFTGHGYANYGCGTYGADNYGDSCATSSSSSSSSSPSPDTPPSTTVENAAILLDSFGEYYTSDGKILELNQGQLLYFNTNENGTQRQHSILVKTVGTDYVILTFDSADKDIKLYVGQTLRQDVTSDGEPDIEITLESINGAFGVMRFKKLSAVSNTPQTPAIGNKITEPAANSSTWKTVLLILFGILIAIAVLWFIVARRRHNDNKQPDSL